jgi:hypothetical protein
MLGCNNRIGAFRTKPRALFFKARQDRLLDVIITEVINLFAADERHRVFDFLSTSFGYLSSAHPKTMQWSISMWTQPRNITIAWMCILLKSTLQDRHQLIQKASINSSHGLVQEAVAWSPIHRCKWASEGED